MPVAVTKTSGVPLVDFSDIQILTCFESGGRLYAKIPDSTQQASATVINAIRLDDLTLTGFNAADKVYAAEATIDIQYSTTTA